MRHALITTHLMHQARSAAAEAHWRQDVDAPAEPPADERRPRRLASLRHRARRNRGRDRALRLHTRRA
jgi:hypothetical protein